MKKLILALFLFGFSFLASAQNNIEEKEGIRPGMRYEYLKKIYKPKDYYKYSDLYGENLFSVGLTSLFIPGLGENLFSVGLTSLFIPGLGDNLVDEGLRGFIKFGSACALVGADLILNSYDWEYCMYFEFAIIGYWIWNVVDSIRVAMVKNMYFTDLYSEYGVRFNIAPTFSPIVTPTGIAPTAGLSLSLSF